MQFTGTRILVCLAIVSGCAWSHDLYLVTNIPGAQKQICARIGEDFPESTNAITADRLNVFRFRTGVGTSELKGDVKGKQFCAPLLTSDAGVVELNVQPRFIRIEAKGFNEYIHGEGFKHVVEARKKREQEQAEGRELYSRYSKLLIGRVGELATKPLGHALEIVPERDPSTLKAGEPLSVTVLFKGRPLTDAQIAAVYSGAKLKGHHFPVMTRTDADGRAELKLDRAGLWYARLIYMEPIQDDPEIDWRSYFATLTFVVPAPST